MLTADFCGVDTLGNPITNCAGQTILAPKGEQLPYTPKFKGDVTARYTFDMMGWNGHAQASVAFQTLTLPALRLQDLVPLGDMPGYASLDLAFGGERGKTSFELFIKNATDSRGQTNRFSPCSLCEAPANSGIPAPQRVAPAIYVSTITPLTVGIRLGQKF